MKIILKDLSKRFNRQWIFQNLNYELESGQSYAITGPNGSGKSTLLQVIIGSMPRTSGDVSYILNGEKIEDDLHYEHCVLASPYLELIEEFTLKELLDFHFKFKTIQKGTNIRKLTQVAYLEEHLYKPIKNFSSGMKQRLKLALAFYSDTPILILDEPTSNLDAKGIQWYLDQVNQCKDRLIIVASNQKQEYEFCKSNIHIPDYVINQ